MKHKRPTKRSLETTALRTTLQSVASTLALYTVKQEPVPADIALNLYTTIQSVLQGDGANLSNAFNEMAKTLEQAVEDHRRKKMSSNS